MTDTTASAPVPVATGVPAAPAPPTGSAESAGSTGPAETLELDLLADWHVHTDLGRGTATAVGVVDAAQAAGLHTVGLCDEVTAATEWLPDYVDMARAFRRPGISVLCGVETAVLDPAGRLDLPAELPALDYVLLVVDALPTPDGPVRAEAVRQALDAGDTTPGEIVERLVSATVAAVRGCPARPVLGRPFALLAALGLSDDLVADGHLSDLTAACRDTGARVEVGERSAVPSARIAAAFQAAGVTLVAGSDALDAEDVGAWDRLAARAGSRPATPATALQEIVAADGAELAAVVNDELADVVEAVAE